jgi:hypothetical protein
VRDWKWSPAYTPWTRDHALWETPLLLSRGCERSRIVSAMYILYCKRCATRGVGVGDAHGQGRSQDDMGMRGATKCGRLCRLRPTGVKLSFQVLRLTQKLGQGQPSLIAMFPHVARFVVNILRWRSFLGCRPRVYFLWKWTFEGQLLHRYPLSLLLWCVLHGSRQDLCHDSPHLRDTTGLRNPRLSALR